MFSLYNDLVYTYLCYDIAKIRDIKLENNPEECYHEDRGYYNDIYPTCTEDEFDELISTFKISIFD